MRRKKGKSKLSFFLFVLLILFVIGAWYFRREIEGYLKGSPDKRFQENIREEDRKRLEEILKQR